MQAREKQHFNDIQRICARREGHIMEQRWSAPASVSGQGPKVELWQLDQALLIWDVSLLIQAMSQIKKFGPVATIQPLDTFRLDNWIFIDMLSDQSFHFWVKKALPVFLRDI